MRERVGVTENERTVERPGSWRIKHVASKDGN